MGAIIVALATAYSAYAPVKLSLVTPNTSSPILNLSTPGPIACTTPDKSDPRVSGSGCGRMLLPLRIQASQGPTPAAFTCTTTSPPPGSGLGTSSMEMASGGPKLCTRTAFIAVHLTRQGTATFSVRSFARRYITLNLALRGRLHLLQAEILPCILAVQIFDFLLCLTDLLRQLVDLSAIIMIRFDIELLVVFP